MWRISLFLLVFLFLGIRDLLAGTEEEYIPYHTLAQEELFLSKEFFLREMPYTESPVSVFFYEREYLERFGFKNLRNFFNYLPSFHLKPIFGERSLTYRGFRSITSASVLFLEDGFRMTSPDYESIVFDWAYPLEDVERVEVMQGAGGSIYGAGSFSGVINLKRISEEERKISLRVGELGERGFLVKLSQGPFMISAQEVRRRAEERQGIRDYDVPEARTLSARLSLKRTEVTFFASREVTKLERRIDGLPIPEELKGLVGDKLKVNFYFLGLKREGVLGSWRWTIKPSFTLMEAWLPNYTSLTVFPAFKNLLKPQRFDLMAYLSGNLAGGEATFGTEWQVRRYKNYESNFYLSPFPGSVLSFSYRYPQDEDVLYAFFFSYGKPFGRWHLHLGGRLEHVEGYFTKFLPRFGLTYKLTPKFSLLFSYTQGMNVPSFYHKKDRTILLGPYSYPFFKLSPEEERTKQVSLLYASGEATYFRGTLFFQEQKNRIWFDPKVRSEVNLPTFKVRGLELEFKHKADPWLTFLNLTLFDLRNGKNLPFVYEGKYLEGIPLFMLKGGISFKIPVARETYLSSAFRLIGETRGREGVKIPGYGVVDFYFLTRPHPRWEIGLKVENLLDKDYTWGGGEKALILGEGRRFRLDILWKF